MKKWEEEYEKFKNGEMDNEIEELKQKVEDKTATKEEYKKYDKMSKVKENLYKVDNIIEFKDILKENLKEIKEELSLRESLNNANKDKISLEVEMNVMMSKKEDLINDLKEPNLDINRKEELTNQLKDLNDKMVKNNEDFAKNQAIFQSKTGRIIVN